MYTIAMIEDNPADRSVLRIALERTGAPLEILEYTHATEAIPALLLRKEPPDLILVDGFLPQVSSEELIRRLKSSQHLKDVSIFVVSGMQDPTLNARLRESGAAQTFLKPFDLNGWLEFGRHLVQLLQDDDLPDAIA